MYVWGLGIQISSMLRRLWRPLTVPRFSRVVWAPFSHCSIVKEKEGNITPWYVAEARKIVASPEQPERVTLPPLPADAPAELEQIVKYAVEEMRLKDVVVIDKRNEQDISGALGPALIVLGTGASSRHLGRAGALLQSWLKQEYGVYAGKDGVLTTNFVKLHNRRQNRKQQRQRMASETTGALARVGSWVAIETKLHNVYVHLMTAERREEVDLEHLDDYLEEFDSASESDTFAEYVDPASPKPASSQFATRNGASQIGTGQSTPFRGKTGSREYSTSAQSIPASREELALENLVSERREDLTDTSREIRDFVDHFPTIPTREDWKVRLQFFALAAINSPSFPLERVVDEAEKQQVCGFVLDDHDIEMVLSSICYHGLSQFASLSRDDEAMVGWKELCDIKADLISRFYDFAMLPADKKLLGNPRLLTLLYRTFTGMSAASTTPAAALQNPEPAAPLDAYYDIKRLTPVRYLLESTGGLSSMQTVSMLLVSLANARLDSPFWKVAEGALMSSTNPAFTAQLAELVVCLAIKTGDAQATRYAISTFLPQKILANSVKLTPTLANAVKAGLKVVDPSESVEFRSLRQVLANYEEELKLAPQ